MAREEGEDGRILGRSIIASSELGFGIGPVIIKNVLIFRFILSIFIYFLVTRDTRRRARNIPTTRQRRR
jgi:hypothetical protein